MLILELAHALFRLKKTKKKRIKSVILKLEHLTFVYTTIITNQVISINLVAI